MKKTGGLFVFDEYKYIIAYINLQIFIQLFLYVFKKNNSCNCNLLFYSRLQLALFVIADKNHKIKIRFTFTSYKKNNLRETDTPQVATKLKTIVCNN
jgi:hypothetical protein